MTQEERIKIMGEELGSVFNKLYDEVLRLLSKWSEYVELFGKSKSRIDLLNNAAPWFFYIVQNTMYDETLLHICRLTESEESYRGKYKHLTIQNLTKLINKKESKGFEGKELDAKKKEIAKKIQPLKNLIEKATEKAKPARDWRDREIAHKDFKLNIEKGAEPLMPVSRKIVQDALEAITNVLKEVYDLYFAPFTKLRFDVPTKDGGALSLLYLIDDGLKADEERRRNINYPSDDFKPRYWENTNPDEK